MKRIAMMMIRNFFFVIYAWFVLTYYSHHLDKVPEEKRYRFLQKICSRALKGGNVSLVSTGTENIPESGGFMFFPNHQGMFDLLTLINVCPRPISVVAKKEVKNIPVLRKIFACMEALFMDREDLRQSMQVIQQVTKEVQKGRSYTIFPEGTRSKNGNKLNEFKAGSFKSAQKAKCPIVPVALIDSYKVFDTGSIKKQIVQVHILPPLLWDDYKDMKTTEIAEEVKRRIEKKIEENT